MNCQFQPVLKPAYLKIQNRINEILEEILNDSESLPPDEGGTPSTTTTTTEPQKRPTNEVCWLTTRTLLGDLWDVNARDVFYRSWLGKLLDQLFYPKPPPLPYYEDFFFALLRLHLSFRKQVNVNNMLAQPQSIGWDPFDLYEGDPQHLFVDWTEAKFSAAFRLLNKHVSREPTLTIVVYPRYIDNKLSDDHDMRYISDLQETFAAEASGFPRKPKRAVIHSGALVYRDAGTKPELALKKRYPSPLSTIYLSTCREDVESDAIPLLKGERDFSDKFTRAYGELVKRIASFDFDTRARFAHALIETYSMVRKLDKFSKSTREAMVNFVEQSWFSEYGLLGAVKRLLGITQHETNASHLWALVFKADANIDVKGIVRQSITLCYLMLINRPTMLFFRLNVDNRLDYYREESDGVARIPLVLELPLGVYDERVGYVVRRQGLIQASITS